jgi:signal transduction histidine kinase
LSQTIRALLLLSQAESGQLTLQMQRIDMAELAADIVEQFQIPAEGARIRLTAELPGECPLDGDRVQIERLLSNLLSNAVKYTPSGGAVRVRLVDRGDAAVLSVSDTGVGIPDAHLPHIFERFYRVPESARRVDERPGERGMGLGLSFVAWIVKAHRGTVAVKSTPGKGTTFTVTLPRRVAMVRPAAASVEATAVERR